MNIVNSMGWAHKHGPFRGVSQWMVKSEWPNAPHNVPAMDIRNLDDSICGRRAGHLRFFNRGFAIWSYPSGKP